MTHKMLTDKDIEKKLSSLTLWKLNKKKTGLERKLSFDSPVSALAFIAKVLVHAEILGHHPNILFSHTDVAVTLTTPEAQGLTRLDFELAGKIDRLGI